MRIVHKYGGTSMGDDRLLQAAAARVAALARQGHQMMVVVSARGDTTDRLAEEARRIHPGVRGRELDAYLATGEQQAAALMAMALEALGCEAVSFTGARAGIRTDGNFGNAAILSVDPGPIEQALEAGKVAVVAGFQGVSPCGAITTLGRGGSDTTAVALAASFRADLCRIYKDVDGIYDRDPHRFPRARRFDSIGYGQMLDLIAKGAQVLHGPGVELARRHGIRLEVRSAFTDEPGTLVFG